VVELAVEPPDQGKNRRRFGFQYLAGQGEVSHEHSMESQGVRRLRADVYSPSHPA